METKIADSIRFFFVVGIFDKYEVCGAEQQTAGGNLAKYFVLFVAARIFDKYQVWGAEQQSSRQLGVICLTLSYRSFG